ncbi:MAG: YihY/virulence factor BrkB family protein [Deltaproteobacteria bacterium]|nr:YihY/virulence factor BrkB family protein [Deltaproteobacteria bacterium]
MTWIKKIYGRGDYYLKLLNRLHIPRNAASLSFFTIVSIFPLCYFTVNVMSYFVSYDLLVGEVLVFLDEFFPYQSPLVVSNLKTIFANRGEFSFYGAFFLFLSAGVLYVHMQHIIADMLEIPRRRNFFLTRLFFVVWLLGMVLVLFAPLVLGFATGVIASWGFQIPLFAAALSEAGVMVFGFLIFALIMLSLHLKKVKMRRLVLGGFYFAIAIQLGKQAYQWMTAQNLGRYNLVYGSFSSLMLGILWIYYFYSMFLFFVYWTTHKEVSD